MINKYIAIVGLDGVGKSTQMDMLKQKVPNAFYTREPTDGVIGEFVRNYRFKHVFNPLTNFLLTTADRNEHIVNNIIPAVVKDKLIISDRCFLCGLAYSLEQNNLYYDITKDIVNGYMPSTVIFLKYNNIADYKARLTDLSKMDSIEKDIPKYFDAIQNNYIYWIEKFNIPNVYIIPATKDKEDIHNILIDIVKQHNSN